MRTNKTVKIKAYICFSIVTIVVALVVLGVIYGYFITARNDYGELMDGFGRVLDTSISPGLDRILVQWAGIIWFIIDCVIIICAFLIADLAFIRGKRYLKDGY